MNFNNDYLVSSNNSINDNKVNAKKVARNPMHQIKKMIKSILMKSKKKNSYKSAAQPPSYFNDEEIEDNLANEILENEIFEEIDCCEEFAAVPIYNEAGADILPIVRGQRYIPVNFARTDAGTFFWTSIASADSDIVKNNAISSHQVPELQVAVHDRWAQA